MLLSEIKRGMTLAIALEDKREFKAEYLRTIDYINFEISSPDIAKSIDALKGVIVNVKFFSNSLECDFNVKINDVNPKFKHLSAVTCSAESQIKEISRRNSDRINLNRKVKVYSFEDDVKGQRAGELLFEGRSDDISMGGLCLSSDSQVELLLGSMYVLEFSPHSEVFNMPAKLIRTKFRGSARICDYGFMFDPDSQAKYGEKLILDILKSKIESRK